MPSFAGRDGVQAREPSLATSDETTDCSSFDGLRQIKFGKVVLKLFRWTELLLYFC